MEKQKQKRGFAVMDPARQREIASRGGKSAHAKGVAHRYTSEEAQKAGKIGGSLLARSREHMAAIGATGGRKSGESRRRKAAAQ
jgi:general stress protein YciG